MRAVAAFLFVGAVLVVASYGTAQPPGGDKKGDKGPGGDKGGKGQPGGDKGGFKGGFGMKGGPALGQVMPLFVQEQLKLTDAQKTDLDAIQKDVDAKIEKLLTEDQKKQLKELKERGPGRGPGGPGGPPPGDKGGNPPPNT